MPLGETIGFSAIAGAGVGLLTILINKFKCYYDSNNDTCKCGITENTITDAENVEFRVIRANGHDLVFVSKCDEIIPFEREESDEVPMCSI